MHSDKEVSNNEQNTKRVGVYQVNLLMMAVSFLVLVALLCCDGIRYCYQTFDLWSNPVLARDIAEPVHV